MAHEQGGPSQARIDREQLPPPHPLPPRRRRTGRAPVARIVARDRRRRRQARVLGAVGFAVAAVLPAVLFHREHGVGASVHLFAVVEFAEHEIELIRAFARGACSALRLQFAAFVGA